MIRAVSTAHTTKLCTRRSRVLSPTALCLSTFMYIYRCIHIYIRQIQANSDNKQKVNLMREMFLREGTKHVDTVALVFTCSQPTRKQTLSHCRHSTQLSHPSFTSQRIRNSAQRPSGDGVEGYEQPINQTDGQVLGNEQHVNSYRVMM